MLFSGWVLGGEREGFCEREPLLYETCHLSQERELFWVEVSPSYEALPITLTLLTQREDGMQR